jgi:GNAT superfamily N-acetyltransferase
MARSGSARSRSDSGTDRFAAMSSATDSSAHSFADVVIRRATVEDAPLLATLAASTFADTFAEENDPADMRAYVATAFGDEVQRAELADPRHVVLIAERDGDAVGYAMLRDGVAPEAIPGAFTASDSMEIARLYAVQRHIGAGIGSALMQRCLGEAVTLGRRTVWLGVWERNARAIAFYARWGFVDVGAQTFTLGSDVQHDRVMARRV